MGRRIPILFALLVLLLAACSSGPVRRVSEPAASIQQLTVRADGSWSVDLRLQNYSSIQMRFEALQLAVGVDGRAAGSLDDRPGLAIGPESADIVTVTLEPSADARMALADALASGRGIGYTLEGSIDAAPADRGSVRSYPVKRTSALSPAPGLPGVLR